MESIWLTCYAFCIINQVYITDPINTFDCSVARFSGLELKATNYKKFFLDNLSLMCGKNSILFVRALAVMTLHLCKILFISSVILKHTSENKFFTNRKDICVRRTTKSANVRQVYHKSRKSRQVQNHCKTEYCPIPIILSSLSHCLKFTSFSVLVLIKIA